MAKVKYLKKEIILYQKRDNMLTKNQVEVLNLFRKNIFLKASILKIKNELKKSSYQRVYDAVKFLAKDGILKIEEAGKSSQTSLIMNQKTISQLAFLDEQEAVQKNIPNYSKIISIKEISNYLIIAAGSYAKGNFKKTSDLDLIVVIPDDRNIMKISKLIDNLTLLYLPKIHLFVFNNKNLIDMLLSKEENYGKEIFRNHLILKNAYIYYELLKESVEKGFRGC